MHTIHKADHSVTGSYAGAAQGGMEERAVAEPISAGSLASTTTTALATTGSDEPRGQKVRAMLRARLGDDIYTSWFNALEFESFDGGTVRFSVPVKFLRTWIQSHYSEDLLDCCRAEFKGAEKVEVALRQPGNQAAARVEAAPAPSEQAAALRNNAQPDAAQRNTTFVAPAPAGRTSVGGFEGSPLDPRYTFESFVVGPSNRMAHAGATQVAETALGGVPGFNPLYLHSAVGLGKTHLLHAIAWEVKRRSPNAQVLYLTAERFRYQFVEALRSQDPLAFKEKFRDINVLLIDDLEFMHGERTEQEFDHIINSLLDGGRQVVVASARAPNHVERLNERMRSRLQRGLVTEIATLDYELRLKVLETRLAEKRALDPSFTLGREIISLLAERLTESGRELEGAITRLYATWQYMRTAITPDVAETVIRDLVQGLEPRRIKIEDILRIVSRHFGVSKGDLLSQRRHRSVVWPRQIGMYLAKQLTARSLPEIGRRFGNRDHTTVLHAIRKIEGELSGNPRLKEELEELKRLLSH
ncbi:chromosomal replication initiator protein DnaA [Hyphomicrobium sulfonivorans]|nr:chromosomal replication initiator protein DnaA [Hyphomicrobium sulfonivorans]MBI1648302.1 chromosomal replication initiator protein DnaA [Hyphomicrobium sulfonivorans]NSL71163.1 chromosomal replication initiator protein DnaA [Hyphomicrobium sulfonivorans]